MCWASGCSKIKYEQHNQHFHDVDYLPSRFWRIMLKRVTFCCSVNGWLRVVGALGMMSVDISFSILFFASLRVKFFQACSNAGWKPIFLLGVSEGALKADEDSYLHSILRRRNFFDMENITDLQMWSMLVTMEKIAWFKNGEIEN